MLCFFKYFSCFRFIGDNTDQYKDMFANDIENQFIIIFYLLKSSLFVVYKFVFLALFLVSIKIKEYYSM